MPKLSPVHYKKLVKVFESAGFKQVKEEGDHLIFTKAGILRPVVIPSTPAYRCSSSKTISGLRASPVSSIFSSSSNSQPNDCPPQAYRTNSTLICVGMIPA